MENTNLMLFFCLSAPLSMMIFVFKDRARTILAFILTGLFMCLFAGEINGLIGNITKTSPYFLTVNITPIVEEVLKALPVVFFAFVLKPERQLLLECSVAVGVGFATMENSCVLFEYAMSISAGTIIARGIGAGMMHGISTLAVGYSMEFVRSDRKLSYTGTVAALSVAIIYHSIYNILVQSDYPMIGILLPIITYIPLIFAVNRTKNLNMGKINSKNRGE